MEIKEYTLKIKEIIDDTSKVKVFRCEIPDGTEINFYCGQFFMVSIEGDEKNMKRAYSIASSPSEKKYIEVALDKVGTFSTKLFDLKPGDTLIFKGPYGKFYFTEEMKHNIVLIGGGVGITPLMSKIRYCNDKKLGNKIKFLYSVRTPQDIIYKDELEKIKNENNNFDYIITVTRPEPEHDWEGRTGRINEDLLKENIEDVSNSLFFMCGPNEFVKAKIEMLEKLGVTKEQIKTDVWG